jgi:hypothetical protein
MLSIFSKNLLSPTSRTKCPEDGSTKFPQNVGIALADYTAEDLIFTPVTALNLNIQ